MKRKLLSKQVLQSLTSTEKKQLDILIQEHQGKGLYMITVQREYADAVREKKGSEISLRKMADKGFQAEYETMQAMKKLQDFIKMLQKKYDT